MTDALLLSMLLSEANDRSLRRGLAVGLVTDMGLWGFQYRNMRAASAAALLSVAWNANGCASSTYAGIPFAPGAADLKLQSLARQARSGDKRAQLELGIRFEEGRGVEVDLPLARRLYRAAAEDDTGTIPVWLPAAGKTPGRIILVAGSRRTLGLADARLRLAALDAVLKRFSRRRYVR